MNSQSKMLFVLAVLASAGFATSPASAANVIWNVAGGGDWDLTSNNWTGGSPNANRFVANDNATFNNTAGGTINLVGTIDPAAVAVSAASGTYTFTGGALATGTSLAKSGAGTLALQNSNSYTTTITISAGILQINGGSLTTTSTSGTAFQLNGGSTLQISSGSFSLTGVTARLLTSNSGLSTWTQTGGSFSMPNSNTINLFGNNASTAFTMSGGSYSTPLAGLAYGVRGASTMSLSNSAIMTVATWQFGQVSNVTNTLNLGDGVNLTGGASVHLGGASGVLETNQLLRNVGTGVINFNGGTLRARSTTPTFLADLTSTTANVLAKGGAIDNAGFNVTVAEALLSGTANDGGMAFKGGGVTTLSGLNTYNGRTSVLAGTLELVHASNNNLTNSNVIHVASGATLNTTNLNGAADLVLNSGQTLQGTGTIVGNATISNGATLSPGDSPGVITFNNNLTISPGATYAFEEGDLTSVLGMLTLGNSSLTNWTLQLGAGFIDGGWTVLFDYGTLAANFDLTPTFDLSNLGFTPSGPLTLVNDTNNQRIVLLGIGSPVPEPSTASLLLLAALGAAAYAVRRKGGTRCDP